MHSSENSEAGNGWIRATNKRLWKWWPVKAVGTILGMVLFFVAYFWVLRHPLFDPVVMPLTAVDRWIGFWPGALALYVSLWLYVSLAPAVIVDRRELICFGGAWVALSVIGLACFYLFPTTVPRPDLDWTEYPSMQFLKSVDLSGNACPSLHVAFAVFSGVWFERYLRIVGAGGLARAVNGAWCAGIVYSTVATRQHVSLDALAGAVLGVLVAAMLIHRLNASPACRRP